MASCFVRGDIQRKITNEDTWSTTANKKTLQLFLADASKCGASIRQLDFIGAFQQAPVRDRVFVQLDKDFFITIPEYG